MDSFWVKRRFRFANLGKILLRLHHEAEEGKSMNNLPTAETLLHQMLMAQTGLRMGASLFFALSLLLGWLGIRKHMIGQHPRHRRDLPSQDGSHLLSDQSSLTRYGFWCYWGASALVFCLLVVQFLYPFTPRSHQVTTVMALLLGATGLVLEKRGTSMPAFGFGAAALSWVLITATPFLFPHDTRLGAPQGMAALHALGAAIGQGILFVAAVFSGLYIWVHNRLKKKILDSLPILPGLDRLEIMGERSTLIGLGFLTLSMVTGLWLVQSPDYDARASTPKVVWAFFIWLWYLATVFGRSFENWSSHRRAFLVLWGAVWLGLALFGSI